MDAGGELNAVAAAPQGMPIAAVQYTRFPSPSTDDDLDDLYGDFDLGFLPLPPLSPCPSSPPKTPSPGLFLSTPSPSPSPSPPPRRTPSPEPQREPEPEPLPSPTPQHQPPPLPAPEPSTPQHQPPLPAQKPPSPRHQPPLPAPKALTLRLQQPHRAQGRAAPSPPPAAAAATALYIGDLPWWTTDAEVEAALAPYGELRGLYFFADKSSGKSRGQCRADFLHPAAAAAAAAAAALHGRAFGGHHCVASLSRPPGLHRPDADSEASAPNPNPGRGGHASAAAARSNVAFSGDGSALGPMAPRPRAFGAMIGDGGGFPSVGQCGPMPPMVAPHVNPAYLAASRMAMGGNGTGPWHNQGLMAGGFWGGQQPWNFGGCEMPWQQQPGLQQQYRNGEYGKMRSTGRERPGGRNEDRDNGNVRGNPNWRRCGRGGGGERPGEHNRGERNRHREQRERNYDDRDRRGGEKRRYEEYTEERDDWQRRGRAKSSQPRNSDDDDNPRRQSRDSDDDDDYPRRRR